MGSLKDGGRWLPAPLRGEACVAESCQCQWRDDAAYDVVAKIDPNAVDVVTSRAWAMPFDDCTADDGWERAVRMRFRPSIWIEDDEDLAHDVDALISDVERWAGVGSLSDMVSPPATRTAPGKDGRAAFWDEAMKNGLEADHGCGDMLAHMAIRPSEGESSGRHRGAELVLNQDGRIRPRRRAGSAANSACVLSLLAGLAVHPRVVSVGVAGAPFPAQAALNMTQIVSVPRYL